MSVDTEVVKPHFPAEESEIPESARNLVKNGKGVTRVQCKRCGSIVLNDGVARFAMFDFALPIMCKKSELTRRAASGSDLALTSRNEQATESGSVQLSFGSAIFDCDKVACFWQVDDMYQFENVGFCNPVGTIKFLVCADCEIGPIGFHDTRDPSAFYVALERADHPTS